jgi:drug/metabolite transporter (DMT)-like permease
MVAAGVVYPVTDSALNHTSPIMIATLRALAGGALLTILLPLIGSRLPRTRRLWVWAFWIGLVNTTLTQIGISVGTERAGAAVASVLLNSAPFFVAVIARFALNESITRLRAIGLVIGFAGVLLVVLADPGNVAHGSQLVVGLVLALLGAIGWAGGGRSSAAKCSSTSDSTPRSAAGPPPASTRGPSSCPSSQSRLKPSAAHFPASPPRSASSS